MNLLNLLVLRCRDIEASRAFYECIGLTFVKHAHGGGPEHYSHENHEVVIELYPASGRINDKTGLGFRCYNLEAMQKTLSEKGYGPDIICDNDWGESFVVRDPDGRRVEIKNAIHEIPF